MLLLLRCSLVSRVANKAQQVQGTAIRGHGGLSPSLIRLAARLGERMQLAAGFLDLGQQGGRLLGGQDLFENRELPPADIVFFGESSLHIRVSFPGCAFHRWVSFLEESLYYVSLMLPDVRPLTLENIPDAIRVMNESSRDTSARFSLNFAQFMLLSRYWNFSYEHSLIRYVDGEPAAVMLVSTDSEARDGYVFYWGADPKFRSQRLALHLVDASCERLRDDGYRILYGITLPERDVRRYRFIQFHGQYALVDLEAASPHLPAAESGYSVRQIDIDTLAQLAFLGGESLHWTQRVGFLRNAVPFAEFAGAFEGNVLRAYMVVEPGNKTVVADLRSPHGCIAAGRQLLRLLLQRHKPPFSATHVYPGGYCHTLLTGAGFQVNREYYLIARDLCSTPRT